MRTLLDEQFAPLTSSIGFLEVPLEKATQGLEKWRRGLYDYVYLSRPPEAFPQVLHRLEPLMAGARPRELLVSAGDMWTAYFDCSLFGTDAVSTISHLCSTLLCTGLSVRSKPHTIGQPGIQQGRSGSVTFELYGPLRTDFLNFVRTVSVVHDGNRWVWDTSGTVQPFEETAAYTARRVRDRFTSEMLERYCQAMGLDVFNPTIYGPDAVLFQSGVVVPDDAVSMTLAQAQEWAEITPGTAARLPG